MEKIKERDDLKIYSEETRKCILDLEKSVKERVIKEAQQDLRSTIIKNLPEEKKDTMYDSPESGFNECLTEVIKVIDSL